MPRVGKESPRSLADLSPPPGNERKELPAAAFGRAATYAFHWDFSYARGRSRARMIRSSQPHCMIHWGALSVSVALDM